HFPLEGADCLGPLAIHSPRLAAGYIINRSVAYSYAILLELAGKLVVIVGGGRAAVRKAEGLIEGGATKVRCIAPEIEDQMPAEVEKINVRFVPSHVDGAALVFAATSSAETNIDVVRAARER